MYAQANDPGYRNDVARRFDVVYGCSQPDVAQSYYDALQYRVGARADRCGVSTKFSSSSTEGTEEKDLEMTTAESLPVSRDTVETDQAGVDLQPHTSQTHQSATFLDRLWDSTFPCRYPKLYGSILELRNFAHRIQSLWKQENTRYVDIGPVYQPSKVPGFLVLNTRTQGRNEGIRKLHSDFQWLTSDDFGVFLRGWDAAEEWYERCQSRD